MGRRSRKRPVSERPAPTPAPAPVDALEADAAAPRRARSEERVAAITALVLAIANVAFYAAGVEVQGKPPQLTGVLLFAGIMLVAAWGLWTQRYWAVLGFQALLAITVVVAALSLLVASNIPAVILCIAILAAGGWLFLKLVRVLGRMKVPRLGE